MTAHCEACGGLLVRSSGHYREPLCVRCRTEGALFRRRWMADLRSQGLKWREIKEIVGGTEASPKLIAEAMQR